MTIAYVMFFVVLAISVPAALLVHYYIGNNIDRDLRGIPATIVAVVSTVLLIVTMATGLSTDSNAKAKQNRIKCRVTVVATSERDLTTDDVIRLCP